MKRLCALILITAVLAGCGAGASPSPTPPANREELTIASVYAVSVPFIVALNLSEQVVAVNTKSKFWTDADENLAKAGTVGRGAVDLEALAGYAPDVLIHRSNDNMTVEAVQNKLGITVLTITVEDFDDIRDTLTMLGEYFGKEERAQEVCAWLEGKFAMIEQIVADIPPKERKTALVMGGELGRVAGGDMLQSWLIEQAGGVCVSNAVSAERNWVNMGVETVFKWNADYLFCTSSTVLDYNVEQLLADPVWSGLNAVKNGHVYTIPARLDSWDMPGVSCALGAMYMLHRMYPERFGAEELLREIYEYYTFMFGKTFDAAYLGYEEAF